MVSNHTYNKYEYKTVPKHRLTPIFKQTLCAGNLPIINFREENLTEIMPDNIPPTTSVVTE